jgi:hypothetical protein
VKEKDARCKEHDHQVVLVVEKEDGSYGTVQTGSYMFQEYGDDFSQKLAYWAQQNLDDLTSGRVSPIGYHMQRLHMTVEDVAARSGMARRLVRRHMTVAGFAGATVRQLGSYAELFGTPIADLFQVLAQAAGGPAVTHKATNNPYAVITSSRDLR